MKNKLNLLREMVYPSNRLTTIPLNNETYNPVVFKPNTIQLSVGDLFKNIKGFVSNLSITTPQDAPWATSNPNFLKENMNMVYPTFVDVSFEMTVIENHIINGNDTITYRFDETPEIDERPTLQTEPMSTVPKNSADYGYNDIKIKPQSQQAREMRRQADFANNMNVADIGGGGVPGKTAGVIRWDANLK
jgi:hypothetical protein